MIEMEISKVLAQMRTLAADAQGLRPSNEFNGPNTGQKFGDVLQQAIASVNEQQAAAGNLVQQFESGSGDASVAEVMISMQKASLSFQAMTEVRNRLVDAYTQVMNMPI
jgi:flagellar hook-basal body complex protein FliE